MANNNHYYLTVAAGGPRGQSRGYIPGRAQLSVKGVDSGSGSPLFEGGFGVLAQEIISKSCLNGELCKHLHLIHEK